MTTFDVAHVREQNQDLILVPMKPEFGRRMSTEQANIQLALQTAAHRAGLAGHVVTVWDAGNGRMAFRGPTAWRPFLEQLSLQFVAANINKRITID